MTQTALHTSATVDHAVLLTASYGSTPTVNRYARSETDLDVSGVTYAALAKLECDKIRLEGGVQPESATFRVDATTEPFATMSTGRAHAPVQVTIAECDVGDAAGTLRELFFGHVKRVVRNPDRVPGILEVEVAGLKARLAQAVLGMPALTTCPRPLFGDTYELDIDSVKVDTTCTGLTTDSKTHRVTLDSGDFSDLSDDRWRGGYIERDGLRIKINASAGSGKFDLARVPPLSWDGAAVTAVPGSDGTIEVVRDTWNQEEYISNVGYAMPARNPVYDA